jgi:enoyl-CoA hydratase
MGKDFMNMKKNDYQHLQLQFEDSVALLIINRPDKLNALNSDVLYELKKILTEDLPSKLQDITGVIFTGAGEKAFIAGADIAEMSEMTSKQASLFAQLGQEVSFLIENFPRPIIACVNGFALGGGCEMALACDFIFACEASVFGLPEVKLGLIPGFGGTQRLAKIIGRNKAKELIYTGRNMNAQEAVECGLVTQHYPTKDEMITQAKNLIVKLKGSSPLAVSVAKKVINQGVDFENVKGLGLELKFFTEIFTSEDKIEGTKAFLEKRKPQFKGR